MGATKRGSADSAWHLGPSDREQPAGRVLPLVLGGHLQAFRGREPGVRADLDVEGLHQFRVSLRRARSLMAVGGGVFPDEELVLLRALSTWMMGVTSPVRDLDVLCAEMPVLGERVVPELRDGADGLSATLLDRRAVAYIGLLEALDGERYAVLLRRWEVLSTAFRVGGGEPGPDALRRAGPVVDELILRSFERLRRRGRAAMRTEDRAAWHDLRKALKRFRYLVSGFAPMYPEGSFDRGRQRLSRLQDALGRLQDCHVQAEIVEAVGAAAGGRAGLAAGVIADSLHRESATAHARCAQLWSDFDRPGRRRHLHDLLA
ncbi:MAG: CHAD domain-containing protein [Actinobacteria bacterium]|nr:CHAD domain-containing protein [Actinomycetota bacterium]